MRKVLLLAMAMACAIALCGCAAATVSASETPQTPAASPAHTASVPANSPAPMAFDGEWGGAIVDGEALLYAAKLTIADGEATLLLDYAEGYAAPYFGESRGEYGVTMNVDYDGSALRLFVGETLFNTLDGVPFGEEIVFAANADAPPAALSCALADGTRLELSPLTADSRENGSVMWLEQFNGALNGVRGIFTLGEDACSAYEPNDERKYVFVYEGADAREHIRFGAGEITHAEGEGADAVFVFTFQMKELFSEKDAALSGDAPYWDTLAVLNPDGGFEDVSKAHPEYYNDVLIPRFEEAYLVAKAEQEALPKAERGAFQPVVDAYYEALARAKEFVGGGQHESTNKS